MTGGFLFLKNFRENAAKSLERGRSWRGAPDGRAIASATWEGRARRRDVTSARRVNDFTYARAWSAD